MTTVEITLPDALAREAAQAGLLTPEALARMLREQLRMERLDRLRAIRAQLAHNPLPAVPQEELRSEIAAYRSGQHRETGS